MVATKRSQYQSAMTGNAGLNYAAWQLSRRGWHVMPTIRNARGSDLIVTNDDETVHFGVQSKALAKPAAVPLGRDGSELRSTWWIITVNANSSTPTCYVLANDDVRRLANVDKNGGGRWLELRDYDRDEFRDAWDRMTVTAPAAPRSGDPAAEAPGSAQAAAQAVAPSRAGARPRGRVRPSERPEQNGVTRPSPETLSGRAWAIYDELTAKTGSAALIGEALVIGRGEGLNVANMRTEHSRWRKFNGVAGRRPPKPV